MSRGYDHADAGLVWEVPLSGSGLSLSWVRNILGVWVADGVGSKEEREVSWIDLCCVWFDFSF